MSPYLRQEPRTVWEAIRQILDEATKRRDAELWDRAYRLWIQASAMRAPGKPIAITHQRPIWLP